MKFTKFKDGLHYLVDPQTGELSEASINVAVKNDLFFMFYFSCLPEFIKLTNSQKNLLVVLVKISSYNPQGCRDGNVFTNSPLLKQQVRQHGLEWSDAQINNEITKLAKTELLTKLARGSYMLNPDYFWKGTIADRTKMVLTIKNEAAHKAIEVNKAIHNGEY